MHVQNGRHKMEVAVHNFPDLNVYNIVYDLEREVSLDDTVRDSGVIDIVLRPVARRRHRHREGTGRAG